MKDMMSLFKFFYKVFLIRMMNKGLDLLFYFVFRKCTQKKA